MTWTDEDQQVFELAISGNTFISNYQECLNAAKWATERERAHWRVLAEEYHSSWEKTFADHDARIRREIEPVIADLENWGEVLKLGRRHEEAAVVGDWIGRLLRALGGDDATE